MTELKQQSLSLLRQALDDSQADFREGQWEAIAALLEDQARLLVVQRTGWGKSIVYFLTTRILRDRGSGFTVLVSPLLALMRNQIAAAQRLGIRAATINSSNQQDWELVKAQLLLDEVDVLLISPERLANDNFRDTILMPIADRIGFFVVDEAHCISDWGHDFRPDYRRITRVLQSLPSGIPVLATTATANDRVVNDVAAQLGSQLKIIRGTLARASLSLQNISLPSQAARLAWLSEQIPQLAGSGIVYTLTVRDAEQVAEWLRSQQIDAEAYSGKQENEDREAAEAKLLNNEIKVLVATSALGMGFDKPDLGFVIHYQRPGSVVHYYQQVGRAGRAVDRAYGILLSGEEDQEITNYFIESAFPPEAHFQAVLTALEQAEDGLSLSQIEEQLNLSRGQITKVLKLLSVESPAPILKLEQKYFATPVSYQPDIQKIEWLTELRRQEQAKMLEYMHSQECLMMFLARELDDLNSECDRCAICVGQPLLPVTYSQEQANRAVQFLQRSEHRVEPRKLWATDALLTYGWKGRIKPELQAQPGRALALWGDAGWGNLVKQGKYRDGYLSDQLVQGVVEMIQRWQPNPFPKWLTCVPSLNHPDLVPNFTRRLADALALPFAPVVHKIRSTPPQKEMGNSYQQAHNLEGAFSVEQWEGISDPVFLVDDMVDSRWTFTVIAALLRQTGSGVVFPLALALNSLGGE